MFAAIWLGILSLLSAISNFSIVWGRDESINSPMGEVSCPFLVLLRL